MARKVRFPLQMKNGAEVRTFDELKENFDLESVLGYFTDGKLSTWLADRYYDEKAEAVSALNSDMSDLNAKLCEILEIEYQADEDETDLEIIQRRNEKIRILSAVTDDREILSNVDIVALDQEDLYDILDESPDKVYLYGEKFSIPFGKKNICYIGINKPLTILEKGKDTNTYENANIVFKDVKFEDGINKSSTNGEKLFLEGKYREAFNVIEEEANNGNPRAMYLMARYYHDGYEVVRIDKEVSNNWYRKAYAYKEPLSMYGYTTWVVDNSEEQNKIYSQIINDIKQLAESKDVLAELILGNMYANGYGVIQDYLKAIEWYRKAADQGNACAQVNLGSMYADGHEVMQDYSKAREWFRKAAEQGNASAQYALGLIYVKGCGVAQDYLRQHRTIAKIRKM